MAEPIAVARTVPRPGDSCAALPAGDEQPPAEMTALLLAVADTQPPDAIRLVAVVTARAEAAGMSASAELLITISSLPPTPETMRLPPVVLVRFSRVSCLLALCQSGGRPSRLGEALIQQRKLAMQGRKESSRSWA